VAAAVDLRGEQHARIAATHVERADAFGPYILCALIATRSTEVVDVERNLADRLHAVGVEDDPFSFAMAPISAIGWTTPISLLAVMMLMRIVLSVIAARRSSRLISPFFCTGR
jgi:hypothetical protein